MCLCIVDRVYLKSVRQNSVIHKLEVSGTSFLDVRTTGIHEKADNCLHLFCKLFQILENR